MSDELTRLARKAATKWHRFCFNSPTEPPERLVKIILAAVRAAVKEKGSVRLQPDDYCKWDLKTGEQTGMYMTKAEFERRFSGNEMEAAMVGGWYPINYDPSGDKQ